MHESTRERRRRIARFSVVTLYVAGIYFIVVPLLLPDLLGWKVLKKEFGENSILCLAVGFLFLYVAVLTREKHRLGEGMRDILEALHMVLYGPDFKKDRETVGILIRAVRSADSGVRESSLRSLRRMTGEDFGHDPEAWEAWWEKNRSRFRRRDQARENPSTSTGMGGEKANG